MSKLLACEFYFLWEILFSINALVEVLDAPLIKDSHLPHGHLAPSLYVAQGTSNPFMGESK